MTFATFKDSLAMEQPPAGLAPALAGLWWAAKGDWERAHKLVMDGGGRDCAWVHGYLHRFEGDQSNAYYWYQMAGRPAAAGPLDAEWEAIAATLIAAQTRP
jgi:hypothetical protein